MPDKSFSFYTVNQNAYADVNNLLLIEIARSHVVCMALHGADRALSAFELFSFKESEFADLQQVFKFVSLNSAISGKTCSATEIIINDPLCLPVPAEKFNKVIAPDFANIAFGEDPFSRLHFEPVAAKPEIITVFRIANNLFDLCQPRFTNVTFRHTWSSVIKGLSGKASLFPSEYMFVQFYNTFITAAFVRNSHIHFIQSFVYENPDDVLYYLLNICNHFGLDFEMIPIHISGMIDRDFNLYRELVKYFKHIFLENADQSNLLIDVKEYPLHYFTPFFNLAL